MGRQRKAGKGCCGGNAQVSGAFLALLGLVAFSCRVQLQQWAHTHGYARTDRGPGRRKGNAAKGPGREASVAAPSVARPVVAAEAPALLSDATSAPQPKAGPVPDGLPSGSSWRRVPRDSEKDGLPREAAQEPILSCQSVAAGRDMSPWAVEHRKAYATLCADTTNRPMMEVFLDTRFGDRFLEYYGKDGWLEQGWVNFVAVRSQKKGDFFGKLTERMVDSVHRYSKQPIVVVNFGIYAVPELTPERFPRMIVMHARRIKPGISFNFNKLRAVLLARVKVGASIESDMMQADERADLLLNRTREEITKEYPYVMMPTHFLDRDPAHRNKGMGNYLMYSCNKCPKPTLRWGQAQPTWTFWSMPFLARWLTGKLAGREVNGVPTRGIGEDEDLLNVALWSEGANKAWCAWQMGGTDFVWENLLNEHAPGPNPYYSDPERFPRGIPIAFYFGHAEKNFQDVDKAMLLLDKYRKEGHKPVKPYFHNMEFFDTFQELKDKYPDVRCTM